MILDSRIKEGKRPLTCLDVEQAREFVGKVCLFSDFYENFKKIDKDKYTDPDFTAILSIENESDCGDFVFKNTGNNSLYRFILPLEWIKKPKTPEFVPYTLDTWQQEFEPGDVLFFRGKENRPRKGKYYKFMYSGYFENKKENNLIFVALGPDFYAFNELFDLYEIYRNGNWEPFGRKVETIDLNVK